MPMIGIAITTTPERKELFEKTLSYINKFAPKNAFIYVHNDQYHEGINISKNRCIEALIIQGCEHLFLFDDDCYPISFEAFKIFIKSGLNHACLTFGEKAHKGSNINLIKTINGIDYFSNARGVLLYFTRNAIEYCGGMDIEYKKYGFEHLGLSNRLYNRGLIPAPYICPSDAIKHFYCYDLEDRSHKPLFDFAEKMALTNKARHLFIQERKSKDWKPYGKGDYTLICDFKNDVNNIEIESIKFDYIVLFTDKIKAPKYKAIKYVYAQLNHRNKGDKYRILKDWIKKNIPYIYDVTIDLNGLITLPAEQMIATIESYLKK